MRRLITAVLCAVWLLPLAVLLYESLIPQERVALHQEQVNLSLANYHALFADGAVMHSLMNSILCATAATVIAAVAAFPAAYAASAAPVALSGVFGWILTSRILPPAAVLVPLFVAVQALGASDSLLGLAIVTAAANVPMMAWIMRQFMREIPPGVLDAARIDGARSIDLLKWVIIPLAASGFLLSLMLTFVLAWNEYFLAAVLVVSPERKTLPVMAAEFVTGYQIRWGLMLACDVVLITPPLVLSLIAGPRFARAIWPQTSRQRRS